MRASLAPCQGGAGGSKSRGEVPARTGRAISPGRSEQRRRRIRPANPKIAGRRKEIRGHRHSRTEKPSGILRPSLSERNPDAPRRPMTSFKLRPVVPVALLSLLLAVALPAEEQFTVTDYGAVAGGPDLNTAAI